MENETTSTFIKLLTDNWALISGIGVILAYLIEKIIIYFSNNKKKREAYDKIFNGTFKLYLSYFKHKLIYQEEADFAIPDEIYINISKNLDTLNSDIDAFKRIIDDESNIVPEILLQTYGMFDIIDRFRVVDRISSSGLSNIEITDIQKLKIRRAQFFALDEFMTDFFKDIIEAIRKKTSVNKNFTTMLFSFDTQEKKEEAIEIQSKLLRRYFQSLKNQDVLSTEDYNQIIELFNFSNKLV